MMSPACAEHNGKLLGFLFYGSYRPFLDLDAGLVAAGLEQDVVVFDYDDEPHNAADGGDDVAALNGIAHGVGFALLFFLRAPHKEIEHEPEQYEHAHGHKQRRGRVGSRFFHYLKNVCHLDAFPFGMIN